MIQHELQRDTGILIITPQGPLEQKDFEMLAREVDPYIQEKGRLNGLMIHAKSFPGWHDFAALVSHFKFVKNHHQQIAKVAAVTDSGFLSIMPSVAKHFVRANVKHFDYSEKENALKWLKSTN
jgi:tRNA U38,U39,U40 pseudouridine synthase TruA